MNSFSFRHESESRRDFSNPSEAQRKIGTSTCALCSGFRWNHMSADLHDIPASCICLGGYFKLLTIKDRHQAQAALPHDPSDIEGVREEPAISCSGYINRLEHRNGRSIPNGNEPSVQLMRIQKSIPPLDQTTISSSTSTLQDLLNCWGGRPKTFTLSRTKAAVALIPTSSSYNFWMTKTGNSPHAGKIVQNSKTGPLACRELRLLFSCSLPWSGFHFTTYGPVTIAGHEKGKPRDAKSGKGNRWRWTFSFYQPFSYPIYSLLRNRSTAHQNSRSHVWFGQ
jgi:hypothetical protein